MSKLGYVRVSTSEQNTERQLDGVSLDKVFTDKCSGKNTERPALLELLAAAKVGDEVYIHSMDRLARNLSDLQGLVESLNAKGVSVVFKKENLTFSAGKKATPMAVLLLQLLGSVAQFERAIIHERQREGIAKAQKRGVYRGRQPVDEAKIQKAMDLHQKGLSLVDAARVVGVGKTTLYNRWSRIPT